MKSQRFYPLGQSLTAIVAGLVFGFGLSLSQMIDRTKVLGFLDVLGTWDPTLLFVLGGAVGVTLISFRFVLAQPHPLWDQTFYLPNKTGLDASLIGGAIIFGIGWGIAGYCPGPAVVALVLGSWNPLLFLAAFLVGSLSVQWWQQQQQPPQQAPTHSAVSSPSDLADSQS